MGPSSLRIPGGSATVAVLVLVVLAVAGLLALDLARDDRVSEGVTVDGIAIGGQTAEEAEATLRAQLARPLGRGVVAARGDRTFRLGAGEAELSVDVEATVDAAVERSREGIPGLRALGDLLGARTVDADLEPRIRYSKPAVRRFAGRVAERLDREPRDATIEPSAAGLATSPARHGLQVARARLLNRLGGALEARERSVVGVPMERTPPETTLADLAERYPHYVVVDREGFRLLHYESLELEQEYAISVGDVGHNTPAGEYEITTKVVDPTWYVPDSEWAGDLAGEVIPPGPNNPLKSRWLGIYDGIGIHGTDAVDSIGRRASHGCIRMLIPEVEELYDEVPIGTAVYIA